jgi:hypothetical protein
MKSSELWKFEYKVKDFPDAAKINFMENAKAQIISGVKDAVGNLTRGILDVDGKIDGNTIAIKIVDLRSRDAIDRDKSANYFNVKGADAFFNIVTEDEFRSKVQDGARRVHQDIMRLLTESRNIFTK